MIDAGRERRHEDTPPAELTEGQLIDALQERAAVVPPEEALTELIRRRSPQAQRLSTDIVEDPGYPPGLRASAAVELGKSDTAANRQALAEAVTARDPALVRRVVEALGRIGNAETMKILDRVRPHTDEVKRSVAFARTLIAHRAGLDRPSLDPPPTSDLLELRSDSVIELQPGDLPEAEFDRISGDLGRLLPAIPVTQMSAKRFACGRNEFVVLLHQQFKTWKTLRGLNSQKRVAAVVLKRSQALLSYYVYQYILSDPRHPEGVYLFGVRPSGVITQYGEAKIVGNRLDAWVRSMRTPHSPPIDLHLSYDQDAHDLHFETALVNPQPVGEQRRAKTPRKI